MGANLGAEPRGAFPSIARPVGGFEPRQGDSRAHLALCRPDPHGICISGVGPGTWHDLQVSWEILSRAGGGTHAGDSSPSHHRMLPLTGLSAASSRASLHAGLSEPQWLSRPAVTRKRTPARSPSWSVGVGEAVSGPTPSNGSARRGPKEVTDVPTGQPSL